MEKYTSKLIFFDLDDTILKKDKSISKKTLDVLSRLQEDGHILIMNTARNLVRTIPVMEIIKPDYAIINAGALIIDKNNNVVRRLVIDKNKSKELVDELLKYSKDISIQTDDILYEATRNKDTINRQRIDLTNFSGMEAQKILVKDLDIKKGYELASKYDLEFENYFGGPWGRFCAKDVTKAKSLSFLTSYLNKDIKDTMAFGDDLGDIEMIKISNIGVAPSNALEEVKKIADFVCDSSDNDGVGRFLDQYFKLNIYK